jgi:hypothetical protein
MDHWEPGSKTDGPEHEGAALVCLRRKIEGRPVVYLGMNGTAHKESDVIKRGNAGRGGVSAIINADQKQALIDKLADVEQVKQVVATWCLSDGQVTAVADLIEHTAWGRAKALLLCLADVYAQAETGRRRVDRVVLSGECYGSGLFSREHDTTPVMLDFEDFIKLRRIFPIAAGQVKHLLVSGCSSGFQGNIRDYREMYPGVQTIMAYASKAPSGQMARSDIAFWESHTAKDGCRTLPYIAERKDPKHPQGEHGIRVATWSASAGYRVDEKPLAELLAKIRAKEPDFLACQSGAAEPDTNPGVGAANGYFRLLMELVNRQDYEDEAGRARYATQREQAMRLRQWVRIRVRFGQEYDARLTRGFRGAGLQIPDFASITRAQLVGHIRRLEAVLEISKPGDVGMEVADVSAALRLLKGLRDLDSTTIPQAWLER